MTSLTSLLRDHAADPQPDHLDAGAWNAFTARTCAPIIYWSARDVWGYIAARVLPVNPVYAMSFGGRLDRDKLRVDLLGLTPGREFGREEWERVYFGSPASRSLSAAVRYPDSARSSTSTSAGVPRSSRDR